MARWLPAAALAAALAITWTMAFGGGIPAIVAWYVLQLGVPALAVAAALAVLLWTALRRRLRAPAGAALALAAVGLWPAGWLFGYGQVRYPARLGSTQPSATVRLPADAPLTVGWGGDRLAGNYHAFTPDQRWAYDLLVAPYAHGGSRNEDYGCFGVPVLAPAAGVVAQAVDGLPDETPGILSNNVAAPLGNHVAIELPGGTFLLLAHLRRGSVAVAEGDAVAEGAVLGECGNSGNTSEPHLHLHHQRQDPRHFPVGFAEGLPLYFRDHDGPAMPEGGFDVVDGRPVLRGPTLRHTGAR